MFSTLLLTIAISLPVMFAQNCDPGVCAGIPGLVYNPELDQCAWPDEVGCSLKDLGYSSNCDGMGVHDLKPVDFNVENLPEGRSQTQYFIVCVPEKTEEDRQARTYQATGPLAPRLLGCPGDLIFDAQDSQCVSQ